MNFGRRLPARSLRSRCPGRAALRSLDLPVLATPASWLPSLTPRLSGLGRGPAYGPGCQKDGGPGGVQHQSDVSLQTSQRIRSEPRRQVRRQVPGRRHGDDRGEWPPSPRDVGSGRAVRSGTWLVAKPRGSRECSFSRAGLAGPDGQGGRSRVQATLKVRGSPHSPTPMLSSGRCLVSQPGHSPTWGSGGYVPGASLVHVHSCARSF